MSFFESNGVWYQENAQTIKQALRSFAYSCNRCCFTGQHIDCEHCAIAGAHEKIWGGANA